MIELLESDVNELFRATKDADSIARWYLEPEERQRLKEQTVLNRQARAKQAESREAMKPENRLFLQVPYEKRHEIKALGGIWDSKAGYWSVPKTIDPKKVEQWHVADLEPGKLTPMQGFDFIRVRLCARGRCRHGWGVPPRDVVESYVGSNKAKQASYCGWVDRKPNGCCRFRR